MRGTRSPFKSLGSHATLFVLAFFTFLPIVVLLNLSLKDLFQFNSEPLGLSFPLHFENYVTAWNYMRDPIMHNVVVALVATSLSLLMASTAAFVFARFRFPGRDALLLALLVILLVPSTVLLVPTYQLIVSLEAHNTLWALILPYAAQQGLMIAVLRAFFAQLPDEMFDAARMDGAGVLQQFWYLAVPLALPALSAMAIFHVWWIWNDYAWPALVANTPAARTVATGLIFFSTTVQPNPGAAMAAAVLAAVPMVLLFLVSMRTFVDGITAGAVKQ